MSNCGTCKTTQNTQSFPCNKCVGLGYTRGGFDVKDYYEPNANQVAKSSIEVQCEKCASKEVCESKQEAYRKFCKDLISCKTSQEGGARFLNVQVFCKYFTKNKNAT